MQNELKYSIVKERIKIFLLFVECLKLPHLRNRLKNLHGLIFKTQNRYEVFRNVYVINKQKNKMIM